MRPALHCVGRQEKKSLHAGGHLLVDFGGLVEHFIGQTAVELHCSSRAATTYAADGDVVVKKAIFHDKSCAQIMEHCRQSEQRPHSFKRLNVIERQKHGSLLNMFEKEQQAPHTRALEQQVLYGILVTYG